MLPHSPFHFSHCLSWLWVPTNLSVTGICHLMNSNGTVLALFIWGLSGRRQPGAISIGYPASGCKGPLHRWQARAPLEWRQATGGDG